MQFAGIQEQNFLKDHNLHSLFLIDTAFSQILSRGPLHTWHKIYKNALISLLLSKNAPY